MYVPEGGPILARFSCAATSVLQLPDVLQLPRHVQLLQRRDAFRDDPQDDRPRAALGEDVDAEARLAGQEVRRVARALAQQVLGETPVVVDQVQREDLGLERRQVFDRGLDGDGQERSH